MRELEQFVLTEQHVKLLQRMNVSWDESEFGAPGIDPKRPYGNSSVVSDMAEILAIVPEETEDGEPSLSSGQWKDLCALHRSMGVALQVVLTTLSFVPGAYIREKYIGDWEKQDEPKAV